MTPQQRQAAYKLKYPPNQTNPGGFPAPGPNPIGPPGPGPIGPPQLDGPPGSYAGDVRRMPLPPQPVGPGAGLLNQPGQPFINPGGFPQTWGKQPGMNIDPNFNFKQRSQVLENRLKSGKIDQGQFDQRMQLANRMNGVQQNGTGGYAGDVRLKQLTPLPPTKIGAGARGPMSGKDKRK